MIILGIGLIAVCLGGAVGYIAVLRGRSFVPWFLYGTFLGPIALPHALLSSNRSEMEAPAWSPIRYGLPSGHRNCPYCDAAVHEDAIACRRCRRPFYGPGSEEAGEGEGDGQGKDEPAEEPYAFEALEAAIARRSAAAHGRRGGRREPPPQDAAERWRRTPPEEAPAARRKDTDGTPSRETVGGTGRAEDMGAATRPPDAKRSAAARTAAQPSRSAPAPEPQPEAEDRSGARSDETPPETSRPATARDGDAARPAARRSELEQSGTRRPGSAGSRGTDEQAAKQPDAPTEDRNAGAEGGTGRDQRPQAVSEPPQKAPAKDPAAPRGEPKPPRRPDEAPTAEPAPRPETTTGRPDAGRRPATARAHQRWRDAAAARHGEQRPLRAGERPGPAPSPQDDLWATWRGGMPKSGADRTRRAAQAAAAVLCVIAVGGIAWWYGPAALQQVAMAPSLFGGNDASTGLDGRAVEVPARELATAAPDGGGSTLASETAARAADGLAAFPPPGSAPAGGRRSGSGGDETAGTSAEVPSQPPVETAAVPAPTGSAANPGDAASDGGGKQSKPPAETAGTSGAPDAGSSQVASRGGDASAAGNGPTRLVRQREDGTPPSEREAPAQSQPVDDLVKAVTAALAEHAGERNASTSATSAEGRATPAAVRITATGELVARVQQLLRARGFAPGPIDGRAGPQTREAIRKYQQRMGMRATGEIDKAMLISLGIL